MQPHDLSTPTGSKPPSKSALTRSALTLVLLVLVVGGIAWVVQYLPSRGVKVDQPPAPVGKKLLAFRSTVALWRKMPETAKDSKNDDKKKDAKQEPVGAGEMEDPVKDVEPGTKGHYDF